MAVSHMQMKVDRNLEGDEAMHQLGRNICTLITAHNVRVGTVIRVYMNLLCMEIEDAPPEYRKPIIKAFREVLDGFDADKPKVH